MDKFIDNRIIEKHKKTMIRTQSYADYICKLFDDVVGMYREVDKIDLYKKDFKLLGKKSVPCTYYVSDDNVLLVLDYSFINPLWCKSFDDIKIDFFNLRNILANSGITIDRISDHPEYESSNTPGAKDLLVFQKERRVKTKSLTNC